MRTVLIALVHCTAAYPPPEAEALGRISRSSPVLPLRTYALYLTTAWNCAGALGSGAGPPLVAARPGEEGEDEYEEPPLELLKEVLPCEALEGEWDEGREDGGESAPDPEPDPVAEVGLWGPPGAPPAAPVALSRCPRGLPGPEVCPTVAEGWMSRQLGPQRTMAKRGPEVILQTCRGQQQPVVHVFSGQ